MEDIQELLKKDDRFSEIDSRKVYTRCLNNYQKFCEEMERRAVTNDWALPIEAGKGVEGSPIAAPQQVSVTVETETEDIQNTTKDAVQESAAVRVPWTKYEAAILLEGYLQIAEQGADRNAVIKQVSETLRKLAVNQGMTIDDIYRNTNGITFQIRSMESAYVGHTVFKPASALFTEIAELYKKDQDAYKELLAEAKRIAYAMRQRFTTYLLQKMVDTRALYMLNCLDIVEKFCIQRKILAAPLFATVDYNTLAKVRETVEGNKLFRLNFHKNQKQLETMSQGIRQYIAFLKTPENDFLQPAPKAVTMVEVATTEADEKCETPDTKEVATSAITDEPLDLAVKSEVDALLKYLNENQIAYVDNRSKQGALWIFGGMELELVTKKLRACGVRFTYKPEGSNATHGKPGWWTKDNTIGLELSHADLDNNVQSANMPQPDESKPALGANQTTTRCIMAEPAVTSAAYATNDDRQKAFRNWMADEGMAESSVRVYVYSVAECGRYAVEHGISTVELYAIGDAETAEIYIEQLLADRKFAEKNRSRKNQLRNGMRKYAEFLQKHPSQSSQPVGQLVSEKQKANVDSRWKEILEKDFPDGYILNDFLSQFQAAGMWQQHYGEACPLEGAAIDQAISVCGTVKDGRVYMSTENEGELLAEIADLVAETLNTYSNIYTVQVYQRYREKLMPLSIFSEKVMAQQVVQFANGRFRYAYSYEFIKPGKTELTEVDCERALRKHGGMMTIRELTEELWFIPQEKISHFLSANSKILNVGTGQWMLVEHFPFSEEDAEQVAAMLEEQFITQEYILARDISTLLKQHLPSIAENVSGLNFVGLFNIIYYYLKDRFGFTRSIVTPAGTKVDFSMLYNAFAREHETFTIDDLESYAKELQVPIYWESIYAGGAVRISRTEFVNCRQINFDTPATDQALESICTGDYMTFQAVPKGMLVLLPPCGYQWNGYLLQGYVYGYSKVFRMSYCSLTKGGYYGAMVRRDCKAIDSYEKLIERVLTDDNGWETQDDALKLIVKQGYQPTQNLKGIDNIVARARQNKLNGGR